jgi:hypothetical protein
VNGFSNISISVKDKDGVPIQNAFVRIFISEQDVTDNTECKFTSSSPLFEDRFTGVDGTTFYNDHNFTHNNSQDLTRVEVVFEKTAFYDEVRLIQVGKYGQNQYVFNIVVKRLNEL